jgi:hypothetical protein
MQNDLQVVLLQQQIQKLEQQITTIKQPPKRMAMISTIK